MPLEALWEARIRPFLADMPFLSPLFRDGLRASEGALAALLVFRGLYEAGAGRDPYVLGFCAVGLVGVGIYALARSNLKGTVLGIDADKEPGKDSLIGFPKETE